MAAAGANTNPLYPDSAFININHLGVSQRSRFNAKQRLMARVTRDNTLIGMQELHLSPARAQDVFFAHLPSHLVLYNSDGVAPGTALLIKHSFLEEVGITDASQHHIVISHNVSQAFWWCADGVTFVFINFYLSAHDAALRCS